MKKLLCLVIFLFLAGCTATPSVEKCVTADDCVPAACCHPTTCTALANAPDCEGMLCTMECAPETMDCGQGHCDCVEGKCEAVFD